MSNGIPTVMSKISADAFRISTESNATCVGEDIQSFKDCVISIYENEEKWTAIQKGGFDFIRQTHSVDFIQSKWKRVIDQSMENIKEVLRHMSHIPKTFEKCPEGEKLYLEMYPTVNDLIKKHEFRSAFEHWVTIGRDEGKNYYNIRNDDHPHGLFKPGMHQFEDVLL